LSLKVFTQRNFVADFLQAKRVLDGKWPLCVFEPPLGSLGATYDDHLRLIGKSVRDFLLMLIEFLSLGVTAEALRANIDCMSQVDNRHSGADTDSSY